MKKGAAYGKLVHRLMAEAWLRNPDPKYLIKQSKNKIGLIILLKILNGLTIKIIFYRDERYESAPRYYTNGV